MATKHIPILFVGLLLASSAHAQDPSGNTTNNSSPREPENRVVLSIGPRMLTGQRDPVHVLYIDQSPSQDRLEHTIDLGGTANVVGFSLFYERRTAKPLSIQIGTEGFIGAYSCYSGFVGAGYHLVDNKSFVLMAGGRLGYGIGSLGLGLVDNNGVYFQIGDELIYNRQLRMSYSDQFVAFTPFVSAEKHIAGRVGVLLSLQGHVVGRTMNTVQFSGVQDLIHEQTDPIEVDLNNVNLTITQNGQRVEKLPLSYMGASLMLGLSYAFRN